MVKRFNSRLVRFLKHYSTGHAKKGGSHLYKQWELIEVRDVGTHRSLICPCGRGNLRYICFIRNKVTRVQTYVGTGCSRHFTSNIVPKLLTLLETLSMQGISGRYHGSKGTCHRFIIRPTSPLVRHHTLLKHFFTNVPLRRIRGGWEVKVLVRHNQHTFRTPRLRKNKWYKLTLGSVTPRGGVRRPRLLFYADRIGSSFR